MYLVRILLWLFEGRRVGWHIHWIVYSVGVVALIVGAKRRTDIINLGTDIGVIYNPLRVPFLLCRPDLDIEDVRRAVAKGYVLFSFAS